MKHFIWRYSVKMQEIKIKELKVKILSIVMIVTLFMVGGHLLDIGDVINDNGSGLACNGFYCVSANKVYHGGYYMMYVAFMVIVILYVNLLINYNYEKWMNKNL